MQYADRFEVVTTEKVPFTYRVAGIGARFLAWLVDWLLIVALTIAGMLFLAQFDRAGAGVGTGAVILWMFALTWGYFLIFEWLWLGQTPGKRVLGIRVIQERGASITFLQAAVRNVVRAVDALPLVLGVPFCALGFGVMAGNARQRRLGDFAAGTLVVHVERQGRLIRALHDSGADPLGDAVTRLRLSQLTKEQKQTLLDLCLRREQLRIADRARLFRAVSEHLQSALGLVPAEHQSDEKFVLALAAALTSPAN